MNAPSASNSPTNGIVRGLTAAAGGGLAVSAQEDWVQIFGAAVTLLSIIWSVVAKTRAARVATANPQPQPTPPPAP